MKQSQSMMIAFVLSIFMGHMIHAQPVCTQTDGSLDDTFGLNGKVVTAVTNNPNMLDVATGVVVLPCGDIVVAGIVVSSDFTDSDAALVRYKPYGAVNDSFGSDGNGRVITDVATVLNPESLPSRDIVNAVAVQYDCDACALECAPVCAIDCDVNCKLVVVGSTNALDIIGNTDSILVMRYDCRGKLDASFGANGNGIVIVSAGTDDSSGNAVAIQDDGKIVVAGNAQANNGEEVFCVVRLNCDGTIDTSFGCQGVVLIPIKGQTGSIARAVKIQKNGKIVIAGEVRIGAMLNFALARLTVEGRLDTTFGQQGTVTTNFSTDNSTDDTARALVLIEDCSNDCAHHSNELVRIVAIGTTNVSLPGRTRDFALAGYTSNGVLDMCFGPNGTGLVTTDFKSPLNMSNEDQAFAAILQHECDGKCKIVVVGSTGFSDRSSVLWALARYTVDGWLDTEFGINGKLVTDFPLENDIASAIALQSNGDLVVAGITSSIANSVSRFAVARYKVCQPCCLK